MTTSEKNPLRAGSRVSLGSAILAGLIGSFANTVAIRLAQATPIPPGTGGFAKLVLATLAGALDRLGLPWRVPSNFGPFGQEVFHTGVGVSMALLYALVFYRRLVGPGWLRGLIFCQIPWLIQAFIVLPWMGSGMLGLRLSPWTPATSFALNAVFGLLLGLIYRPKTINATLA
jgi:hypothetical protein